MQIESLRKNETDLRALLNQKILEYERDHSLIKENIIILEEKDKYIEQLESQFEDQKAYSDNLLQAKQTEFEQIKQSELQEISQNYQSKLEI